MSTKRGRLVLATLLILVGVNPLHADEETDADEELLHDAHVAIEGPALAEFFKQRTPSDADKQKMEAYIRQLGSASFKKRENATKALMARGTPALQYLRKAAQDSDPEVSRRARECITSIESGPGPALPIAAARVLARLHPEGATPALLNYVPFADDAEVDAEILTALVALAAKTPKLDPALTAALNDALPQRRAAAAYVCGRRSSAEERAPVARLLKDADAKVRLRAAQGLIAGNDKAAVAALIALLAEGPVELAWEAEEMLQRLAGEQSPNVYPADESEPARKKWRDDWAAWWEKSAAGVHLDRLEKQPRSAGMTVAIEWNTNRVWECGPDGKARWDMKVEGPMDAQVLAGNRVLIAEAGAQRITERDFKGNILWEYKVATEPINCQRLPNGNTFVGTRNSVLEVNRQGKIIVEHKFGDGLYAHAMNRTATGHYLYIANDGTIVEFDAAGKQVNKIALHNEGTWGDVEALQGGRYLVANYGTGKVMEVDAAGKVLWQVEVPHAVGINRLSNGQMLIAGGSNILVIDRTGKTLWETPTTGSARRAHRR